MQMRLSGSQSRVWKTNLVWELSRGSILMEGENLLATSLPPTSYPKALELLPVPLTPLNTMVWLRGNSSPSSAMQDACSSTLDCPRPSGQKPPDMLGSLRMPPPPRPMTMYLPMNSGTRRSQMFPPSELLGLLPWCSITSTSPSSR